MRAAVETSLSGDEIDQPTRFAKSRSVPVRLAERSQIVLLAAKGLTNERIAEQLGISRQKAGRWRQRYAESGLAAIEKDAARPKRKPCISQRKIKQVIEWTTQKSRTMRRIGASG